MFPEKEFIDREEEVRIAIEEPHVTATELTTMGFSNVDALDLNRVLIKYNITTTERIRHFLAQCAVETEWGSSYTENDNAAKTYLKNQPYYPFIGAGGIHLTHLYEYQALATYLILEKHPDIDDIDGIYHRPSFKNSATLIEEMYDDVVAIAIEKGYDISDYTKLVTLDNPSAYLVKNYLWESAGIYWTSKKINDVVDKQNINDKVGVDAVTHLVNQHTDAKSYKKRRDAYEKICLTIKHPEKKN